MVAVRVQLYKIASSPKSLPGPMVPRNSPRIVTCTSPSAINSHTHMKIFVWVGEGQLVFFFIYTVHTHTLYVSSINIVK